MKTLLPILKTKLFLLGFLFTSTVIIATTATINFKNNIAKKETTRKEAIVEKQKTSNQKHVNKKIVLTRSSDLSETATVQTDKLEYAPGDYVLITGTGWTEGEEVDLHIVSDCGCVNIHLSDTAQADGTISNSEFLITEAHIGAEFLLTATGLISGEVAETNFADGNLRGRTVSPTNTGVTLATTFYSTSADCSGTGTASTFDADGNFDVIVAADDDQSLTLTAPATNSEGEAFRFWRVSGRNKGLKGSRNLTICVPGKSTGILNITAYYGDCPLNGGIPPEPTGVMATPSAICSGGTSSLTANTGNGNLVFWYTSPTGTDEIGIEDSEENFEVTPTETTTYWAESVSDGGCVNPTRVSVTVTVTPSQSAGTASSTPTLCINTLLTSITHSTTGATGISDDGVSGANGLPVGVSASWLADVITISGTPTAAGTFNYTIPLTGGCGTVNATGTITVTPNNTAGVASSTPTLCINTLLTNITHTTTGATGISNNGVSGANGLPAGVSASWLADVITISGTPTAAGTFNYTIPLTGGCGTVNATGTITVTPNAAITSVTGGTSPLCIGQTTNVTANYVVLGGGTGAWSSSNAAAATVNSSGLVTAVGAGTTNITYTITNGCSGTKSAYQAIEVLPNAAITSITGSPSTICPGASTTYIANGVVLGGGTGAWSSTDPLVATVNSSGVVTGIAQGTSNIKYTITDGCSGITSSQKLVTVLAATTIGSEKINAAVITSTTYVYGCTSPTLSVVGSGPGNFNTYRWYKSAGTNSGGTLVSGPSTTGSSFNVPGALTVGTHYYYATYTSSCGTVASQVFTINITQQPADAENDGKLYYTGTCMAWTPTATSNSATVTLAAFIKNKAGAEYTCGDIATARITFQVRNSSGVWTDIPSAQNLPVYYVDPNDLSKGGTANAIVQLNISNNTTQIFDLKVVVSGNYQARPDCGTAQITVSKLIPGGSISGGVLLCGPSSSGLLKPATSILTPSWLGFGVEYTVKGKQVQSPKGKVNLLVPSFFTYEGVNTFPQLNWYKISSNAIASLAIATPKATFTAKANVAKYNPNTGETIAIEGNCTMVLELEDVNLNGVFNFQDKVGITIYRNNGGNWYSNNWVTSKTVPTTICGGDLTVSGITNSAPCISCPTTRTNTSFEAEVQIAQFNVRAFPNPSQHVFSLILENATNEKVQIVVYDALGRQVKMFEKQSGNIPIHFGMDLKVGVYVVEVRQGDNRKTLKLVKQ